MLRTLLILPLLLSCSEAEQFHSVRTVGDTVFVRNLAPVHADTATVTAVERYGSIAGAAETALVQVRSFTVDSAGNVLTYEVGRGFKRFDAETGEVRYLAR